MNSQKLGILLRNFADMIWEYDTETHRLFAEPECAKRCGLPEIVADGARGLVDAGVLHPDYLLPFLICFIRLKFRIVL